MSSLKEQLICFFDRAIYKEILRNSRTSEEYADCLLLEIQAAKKDEANARQSQIALTEAVKHIEKGIQALSAFHGKNFDGMDETHALKKELEKLKDGFSATTKETKVSLIQMGKCNLDEAQAIQFDHTIKPTGKTAKNSYLIQRIEAFWFSHTVKNEAPKSNPNSAYIELLAILTGEDNETATKQRARALKGVKALPCKQDKNPL